MGTSQSGEFPRALTPRESEILDFLLSVDDPRIERLREQRLSAIATGLCGCGCASIDLAVDRAHNEPAAICRQPIAANLDREKAVLPDSHEHYGLLLFLDEGWLSLLEIWWMEEPPAEFPPASSFLPPEVTCERDAAELAMWEQRWALVEAESESVLGRLRSTARAVHRRLRGRPPSDPTDP